MTGETNITESGKPTTIIDTLKANKVLVGLVIVMIVVMIACIIFKKE